jgi:CheY-like chemotaxis protein
MNSRTILVADDDRDFLRMEGQFLTQAGYAVLFARDAYQALQMSLSQQPDVLLLDYHMPAGDGLSVQQRLRATPALRDTPVIYMTGEPSMDLDVAARAMGAFAVLRKPFDQEHLLTTIHEALRRTNPCVMKADRLLVLKTA